MRDKFNKYKFWQKGISPKEYDECYAEDVDTILLIEGLVSEEQAKEEEEEKRKREIKELQNAGRH